MTSESPVTSVPDLPLEVGEAELLGYGRLRWDQVATLLAGAGTAWADYDGFHIGPVPAEPPPYSHLWAWTGQWLARARIDNGTAMVGALALSEEPANGPSVLSRERVRYQRTRGNTWPGTEKRVGQLPHGIADQSMDIYLVSGGNPITFTAPAAR